MKTKILAITLIALIMGLAFSSNAENADTNKRTETTLKTGFQACINLYPDNIVKFQVVKPEQDKVKLLIYGEDNTLLYAYVMKKHNTARIGFDINSLEPGKYHCVIKRNKKEVLRKTIIKEDKNI
jgi:hypothetical protein